MTKSLISIFFEAAWPLIAAGAVGLSLLVLYRYSATGKSLRSTVILFLPGILLVSMASIGSLALCERISSLWGHYQETIERQLSRRSSEFIDLVMTGRYIELNSTLARVREASSLANISIRGMDNHLLAQSTIRTESNTEPINSVPLVRKDIDGNLVKWGVLTYQTDPSQMQLWVAVQQKRLLFISATVVLIVSLFSIFSSWMIGRLVNGLHDSLISLQKRIGAVQDPESFASVLNIQPPSKSDLIEEAILLNSFKEIGQQLSLLHRSTAELEAEARMGRTIAQVVHDIRSPLSLIQAVIKRETENKNQNAQLLKMGCERINSIANDLLSQYRRGRRDGKSELDAICPIGLLIANIVSEKRVVHEASGINLELDIDDAAKTSFARIDAREFSRAISNLIENAFEASRSGTKISIKLRNTSTEIQISIRDEGCGIDARALKFFGKRGYTKRKSGGNGLGVNHAMELVSAAEGQFGVQSTVGVGTELQISLPIARRPNVYCDPAKLDCNRLVVVTTDSSFADAVTAKMPKLKVKIYSTIVKAAVAVSDGLADKILVDADVVRLDDAVEIASSLRQADRLILAFRDVVDHRIQKIAVDESIQIFPKEWLLPSNPRMEPAEGKIDLVLIDDDPLVHMTWRLRSKALNKKILTFSSLSSFENAEVDYMTPIYVDLHLGTPYLGISVADTLHGKGFRKIHFATGDATFENAPRYISSVQGKEFPLEA